MRTWSWIGVVLLSLLVACGGDDPTIAPPPGGATEQCEDRTGADATVEMRDNVFVPACLVVSSGDAVNLDNTGAAEHTFTIDGTEIDVELPPGEAATLQGAEPLAAREHTFYCRYHGSADGSGMAGTIRVEG